MSQARTLVIGLMKAEIKQVEKQVWYGPPDRVCKSTPAAERRLRDAHEASSLKQGEECRARYLESARHRLARYQQTGEIG